jgi:hypothetical protein
MNKDDLPVYGDMLAIPMFALSFNYFYKIKNRTLTEELLMLFSFIGLMADIFFTYNYLQKK